jgi:hypothetical protein
MLRPARVFGLRRSRSFSHPAFPMPSCTFLVSEIRQAKISRVFMPSHNGATRSVIFHWSNSIECVPQSWGDMICWVAAVRGSHVEHIVCARRLMSGLMGDVLVLGLLILHGLIL